MQHEELGGKIRQIWINNDQNFAGTAVLKQLTFTLVLGKINDVKGS